MIYDILPYQRSKWFSIQNYKNNFFKLLKIYSNTYKIFTISNHVKKNILKIKNLNFNKSKISKIDLGLDFLPSKKLSFTPINVRKVKKINFLIVGTIEPRKGHTDFVNAFSEIAKNENIKLDIVGRPGWKYKKIIENIKSKENYNSCIFLHNDVDDKKLKKFYNNTDVCVLSSLDEGFGLPIIEALNFNKVVLARNISVFREIGGKNIYYFKDYNNYALKKSLNHFIKLYRTKKKLRGKEFQKITWSQSAKQIIKNLD